MNDVALIAGAAALLVELAEEVELLDELLELDELPHPAMIATVSNAVATAPIRLKDIKPLPFRRASVAPFLSDPEPIPFSIRVVPKLTLSHSYAVFHRT